MKMVSMVLAIAGMAPILGGPAKTERPVDASRNGMSGQILGLVGNDHVVVKVVGPRSYRATTRSEGRWSISAMIHGTYTLTPIHARYTFVPEDMTVTFEGEAVSKLDFSAQPLHHEPTTTAPSTTTYSTSPRRIAHNLPGHLKATLRRPEITLFQ